MKKAKWFILALLTVVVMTFGAITVYAMSEENGRSAVQPDEIEAVLTDYAMEEQAVSAFYLGCEA